MFNIIFVILLSGLASSAHANLKQVSGLELISNTQKKINLSTDAARVFIFYNSSCPCSQSHFDHIKDLKLEFPQVDFIGFHSNKHSVKKDVVAYFKKFQTSFPIFLDKDLYYANALKALKTPHVFVYGKNNDLLFQGGVSNSRSIDRASKFYLKEALGQISQGKTPLIAEAKALGCYITR